MPKHHILVVEDERDIVQVLEFGLTQAGFDVAVAYDGHQARGRIQERVPDLVLLDLMLPDVSGTDLCKWLRSMPRTAHVPVVMLTARGEEVDRIVGFELGADDFITKPFSVREVILRLKAVLRRGQGQDGPVQARVGPIEIDVDSHRVFVEKTEVELTSLEFKLLLSLFSRTGRVQSRERLLNDVWGVAPDTNTRTVDTHIKRLREKLGAAREMLETVRGAGYRLVDPAEKA